MKTIVMNRKDLCLAQIKLDVRDLLTYSSDLSLMLLDRNMPLDNFRTETFRDDASNLYAKARDLGEPLPHPITHKFKFPNKINIVYDYN